MLPFSSPGHLPDAEIESTVPLSMGFSGQEYWSVLPFSSPGDLPDARIELESPALQADSLPLSYQGSLT